MNENLVLLLQLLLAHVLIDFVFQSKKMVKHKQKHRATSWVLYAHAFGAGFLTYLILQQWSQFIVPLIIAVTHFFIDLWKLNKKKDNFKYFIIDQLLHLAVIFFAWIYLAEAFESLLPAITKYASNQIVLVILTGYLIVIYPVGFIIGKATERWQKDIAKSEAKTDQTSLKKAGRYIGIFERILVLTFILIGEFSAIGFLIGAKSILRFGDSRNTRKQTEYILIGTLMSFAICIGIGLLVKLGMTL
ncbi:DUF3307 domain-containing protein [Gangjinia marincola]|uniref:DUF3307 domain-containing protein n=1 Tax=Gangjinia marincola TaxID=578463 RepID=A0ABN1MGT6_9FLAO